MTIKRQWLKVLIVCAIISVCINTIVLSFLINKYFVDYAKENYKNNLEEIEEYSKKVLVEKFYGDEQIKSQLESYLDDPILGIKLFDINGELIAEVNREKALRRGLMNRMMGTFSEETDTFEISESGTLVGRLNITKSSSEINSLTTRTFKIALIGYSLLSFTIVLFFVIIIGIIMSRKMSKDMRDTAAFALGIDLGNQTNVKPSKVEEIRIIQQSLETLKSKLKLKQTSRKSLLDEMVHQTRTPLTIIKTHLEGFEDGIIKMTPEEIETCEIQIDNITAIISNMSGMIDAEKDIETIKIEEFELNQLLKQIIGGLKVQFNNKQIDLSLHSNENVVLKTDKYKLSQTIYNILTNAYKFTDEKGKVTIEYLVKDKEIIIAIKDTGRGISKEYLERIFDAYFRGSDLKNIPGEGIGLYVAKQNIDKIGGDISVSSEIGKGSEFIIKIPMLLLPNAI